MTHISRTRRVNLDRMFHRNNLDPGIQNKYAKTSMQIADIQNQRLALS